MTSPTVPLHQSTPARSHSFDEFVDVTRDPDGIKHSFDHSMSNPTCDPVSFLGTDDNPNVAQSADVMDTQVDAPASVTAKNEGNAPEGEYPFRAITPVLHSTISRVSPFSQFLRRSEEAEPNEQLNNSPNIVSRPQTLVQFGRFVTSSELEALEQRRETLVNSRLRHSMAVSSPGGHPIAVSTSVGKEPFRLVHCSSTARQVPVESPGKRRHNFGNETSDPCVTTSDDQAVSHKRPRPRLQLTAQMYEKHPMFRFFVTGPADPNKNPYKWRCRVCQVEIERLTRDFITLPD